MRPEVAQIHETGRERLRTNPRDMSPIEVTRKAAVAFAIDAARTLARFGRIYYPAQGQPFDGAAWWLLKDMIRRNEFRIFCFDVRMKQ